jgi:hypothetical protein
MIGNLTNVSKYASSENDALLAITCCDDFVIKGQGFQIRKRFELSSGEILYMVLDTTNLIAKNKKVHTLPLQLSSTAGLIYFDTYAVDSYTGGNLITPLKLNATSENEALSVVKSGVTPIGGPYGLREYTIGIAASPIFPGGGSRLDETMKTFPAGTILIAKAENKETNPNTLSIGLTFYEV